MLARILPMTRLPALVLLSCLSPAASAATASYALDPVHTRVVFAVSHAGFSQAIGTVSGSTGSLQFDPDDWSTAQLQVSVPLARADLGDADWNRAVLARRLLDVERYPVARFVSERVESDGPQRASVYGTLTLHGVSRPLKMEVTLNALKRHPLPPFRRTAGFSATATLSRREFGIDAWPSMIGDHVELRIEAEAVRSHGDAGQDADAATPAIETPSQPEPEK